MGKDGRHHRPWLWLAMGLLFGLLGLVMSLASLGEWGERDAYRRAAQCELDDRDCVVDMTAVVERKDVHRRKSDDYVVWLRLARPEVAHPRAGVAVELPKPDDVWNDLTPGREVDVRLWERRVARIAVPGGGVAETEHSPLTSSVEYTVIGMLGLFGGMYGVWGGVTMGSRHGFRRAPEAALKGDVRRGMARAILAPLGGIFVVFMLVVWLDVYHPAVFLAAPAVGGVVWWALRRR